MGALGDAGPGPGDARVPAPILVTVTGDGGAGGAGAITMIPGAGAARDPGTCAAALEPATPAERAADDKRRRTQIIILLVTIFVWYLGFGFFWFTLPVFLIRSGCEARGISVADCGEQGNATGYADVFAAASSDYGIYWLLVGLSNLVTINAFGELSDSIGRRFAICIPTVGSCVTSAVVAAWPPVSPAPPALWAVIAVVNLSGGQFAVMGAVFAGLNDVLGLETCSVERRGMWQARLLVALNVGIIVSPLVGGALLDRVSTTAAPIASAACYAASAAVAFFALEEPLPTASRRRFNRAAANPFGGMWFLFRRTRETRLVVCIFTFTMLGFVGTVVVAPLVYASKLGWSAAVIGYWQSIIWAANATGNMFVLPWLQRRTTASGAPRFASRDLIVLGSCAGVAACSLQGLAYLVDVVGSAGVTAVLFVVTGVFFPCAPFFDSLGRAVAAQRMGDRYFGLTQSGIVSLQCALQMVCAYMMQAIYNALRRTAPDHAWLTFAVSGALIAMAAPFACRLPRTIETCTHHDDDNDAGGGAERVAPEERADCYAVARGGELSVPAPPPAP